MTVSTQVPPDLEPIFYSKIIAAGGDSNPWFLYQGKALFKNIVPVDEKEGKILLGWRKRGFGKSKYNPFSGPIKTPDRIEDGVRKDLQAQCGLEATQLSKVGKIILVLEGNPIALDIDVYRVTKWRGGVAENDEMRPEWFALSSSSACAGLYPSIPYHLMFADNRHWIPLLASGKEFIGRCDFAAPEDWEDVGKLMRWWFATL